MELYFDVDGVILDFEGAMIDFVRQTYLPELPLDFKLKNWSITDEFKELDMMAVWNGFIDSGRLAELRPLVDVARFNQLSEKYPVNLVTNLPDDGYHYDARVENLAKLNLKYDGLYLAGHFNFESEEYPTKSGMIKRLNRAGEKIVFMDDHPKNCEDVLANIPDSLVYMMTAPHNESEDGFQWERVMDWDDFFNRIAVLEADLA